VSERTDLVARLPWVTRLDAPQQCQGYRYSEMPLAALASPELKEEYCCKNRARWRFRALTLSFAHNGIYCWPHLIARGLHANPEEENRTRQAIEELESP
jgi:hypothetical protein